MPMPINFAAAVKSFDPSEEFSSFKKKRTARNKDLKEEVKQKQTAMSRIIQLCSVRERSEKELFNRLLKEGYSQEEVQAAIERSVECSIVSNERFADAFIRGKVSQGKGVRYIENELAKHDISVCDLPGWPELYGLDEENQVSSAVDFLDSHPPKAKDVWASAYRKLQSKGYPQAICSQAVKIWVAKQE